MSTIYNFLNLCSYDIKNVSKIVYKQCTTFHDYEEHYIPTCQTVLKNLFLQITQKTVLKYIFLQTALLSTRKVFKIILVFLNFLISFWYISKLIL